MSEALFTPGPWIWDAQDSDRGGYRHIRLQARHTGGLIVMDFVRLGMGDAQPRFRMLNYDIMAKALSFGVGKDHHGTVKIDHPDAHLIAAAPDLYVALEAVLASARPNPVEHPAMYLAWETAKIALAKARGEKPPEVKVAGEEPEEGKNSCG